MSMTRIEEIRRRHGWTQYDLASESGVHQTTVSRIEGGNHTGVVAALRIGRALRVPVEQLFADLLAQDDVSRCRAGRGAK